MTDLAEQLGTQEHEGLEFKRDLSSRDSIRRSICALVPKFAGLDLDAPKGSMEPMGYVMLQHAVRLDRPVKAFDRWLTRIPEEFARAVLGEEHVANSATADPHCLATLRNYRSLMPLAQDARKPMFDLRAADGALGSTARLVRTCHKEFHDPAVAVLDRAAIALPAAS